MRTTLDIEDDVLEAAKELAAREGITAGKMLSRLARKALQASTGTENLERRNGVPIIPAHGEIITSEHVRRLMDEEGI